MNEEYTYDIGKYTIGVDKNGEDGIGLTVAIINDNGEIHILGNCYGDNARCIDLLIKENKQLKENNQAMQEEMARTWAKLQQKEDIINKISKKCNKEKGRTDFDIFIQLNEQLKTLEEFTKKIDYNLHPIITEAYKCDIRNSIEDLCKTLRYDVVYKDSIKEILDNKGE